MGVYHSGVMRALSAQHVDRVRGAGESVMVININKE